MLLLALQMDTDRRSLDTDSLQSMAAAGAELQAAEQEDFPLCLPPPPFRSRPRSLPPSAGPRRGRESWDRTDVLLMMMSRMQIQLQAQSIKIDAQSNKIDAQSNKIDAQSNLIEELAEKIADFAEVSEIRSPESESTFTEEPEDVEQAVAVEEPEVVVEPEVVEEAHGEEGNYSL